jgi:hypothetical protein
LAAPLVGKLSDKGSSRIAVGYGCMLIAFSFMIFYFSGSSVGDRLWDNFLDIGLQGAYIKSNVFIRYYLMQETV